MQDSQHAADVAVWKAERCLGQIVTVSFPGVIGAIEPMTWADARVRLVYVAIAVATVIATFTVNLPKSRKEVLGRLMSAALLCFIFLNPISRWMLYVTGQPHMSDSPGSLPFDAGLYAGLCSGVFGWWAWTTIVGVSNNPRKIGEVCGLIVQGEFKKAFQSAVTAEQSSTSTNGVGHGQSGTGETRTPEQSPVKTVEESVTTVEVKTSTTERRDGSV